MSPFGPFDDPSQQAPPARRLRDVHRAIARTGPPEDYGDVSQTAQPQVTSQQGSSAGNLPYDRRMMAIRAAGVVAGHGTSSRRERAAAAARPRDPLDPDFHDPNWQMNEVQRSPDSPAPWGSIKGGLPYDRDGNLVHNPNAPGIGPQRPTGVASPKDVNLPNPEPVVSEQDIQTLARDTLPVLGMAVTEANVAQFLQQHRDKLIGVIKGRGY